MPTLARGVAPVYAADKAHENDVHGAATLKLDNGQKWKTYGEFFDHPGWTESATKHEH